MADKTRWGLIGAGAVASHFALDLIRTSTGELCAVAARNHSRAASFADLFKVPKSYGSYEEMLQDPSIDAVYIAVPNSAHKKASLDALRARKAVLCEKPLATCAKEAREVFQTAKDNNVFCMEAMWTRFLPAIQAVKKRIDSGEIGAIRQVHAGLGFPVDYTTQSRFSQPELGGGALLDLGIYGLSLTHYLLGKPDALNANANFSQTGVDEQVTATLHYKNAFAVITASHAAELMNTFHIIGETGRLEIHAPFYTATTLSHKPFTRALPEPLARESRLKNVLKHTGVWPLARSLARRATGKEGTTRSYVFPGTGYQFEAEEVGRCLQENRNESAIMPQQASVEVLEIADEIRSIWKA